MSLATIVRAVKADMKARGCPHPVILGPERTPPAAYGPTRVVVERLRGPGVDSALPVTSQRANPKLFGVRDVGVKLTVYARSPATGARTQDHQDLAERLCNFALDSLDTHVRNIPSVWTLGAGGFVVLEDTNGSEVDGGAAYEQTLSIADGLPKVATTWAELMADHAAGAERPGAADEVEIVATSEAGPAWFRVSDTTLDATSEASP